MNSSFRTRRIKKALKGWSQPHEFIEIYTMVYILDNGYRKSNPPFVKMDSNGVVDEYITDIGPDAKLRCYMVTILVLPGYGNDEKYESDNLESPDFQHFFGMSYRELVEYMMQFNYEKTDEGICNINFYEV